MYYTHHRECILREQNTNNKAPRNAAARTRELTGRSNDVLCSTVKQWSDAARNQDEQEVTPRRWSNPGNGIRWMKLSSILHDLSVFFSFRDFVMEKRNNWERVTIADVLRFLIDQNVITVKKGKRRTDSPLTILFCYPICAPIFETN